MDYYLPRGSSLPFRVTSCCSLPAQRCRSTLKVTFPDEDVDEEELSSTSTSVRDLEDAVNRSIKSSNEFECEREDDALDFEEGPDE
jgi:hypothetical protein